MKNIELRKVTEADQNFLIGLYGSGRAAEMSNWGWSDQQREHFVKMQYELRRRHYDSVYPERDDRIIMLGGAAVGMLSLVRHETLMVIVDIALLPEFRNRGIGRHVLQGVQQEAAESGKKLQLHIQVKNDMAVRLYKNLGFVRLSDDGVYRHLEWRPKTAAAAEREEPHA